MQSRDQQKAIVQRMVDAGESEENIATVIQHFKTTTPAAPTPRASGLATLGDFVIEAAKGAGKGLASTALGASQLINRGTAAIGLSKEVKPEVWDAARSEFTTAHNTAQSIGKGAEQIAEFFVPGGAVAKTAALAGKLPKGAAAAKFFSRVGGEALSSAAVHTAQTGSTDGAKAVGTSAAVMSGAVAPVASKALKMLGQRVELALIKASARDVQNGFKVGNVYKHQLGGSLETTLKKSDEKLRDLGQQLRTELGSHPNVRVDVHQAITDAATELKGKSAKTWGQNVAIDKAFDRLLQDPDYLRKTQGALVNGVTDLLTANELKQGLGELAAFKYGMRDPDADAMERVANAVYSKLRVAIEKAAPNPGRLKEINAAMGEIIPVRQAVLRRLPVEDRQNPVSLLDALGLATGKWWVGLLNRGLRSGQAADVMVRAGNKVTGNIAAPATAAGLSQIIR